MPLLEGTDGVDKMSKSLGNYIGIAEPPEEIFGKTMSIPDEMILKYFELVSAKTPEEQKDIRARLEDPSGNPSHLKRELARDLITQYYDDEAASRAEAHFDRIHVKHDSPENMEETCLEGGDDGLWIVKALTDTGLCASSSQSRRMVRQGGVRVDGEKISDIEMRLPRRSEPYVVKVGKRQFRSIRVE
jgi:tyrosyl-tRNA synthetase